MSDLMLDWVRKAEAPAVGTPALEVQDLSVRVGIREVIRGLTFSIWDGEFVHVTGPNGSGKSSLLNAIAGLDPALIVGGAVRLRGEDVTMLPPHERARRGMRFMRQRENVFPDLTVEENLKLAAGPSGPRMFRQRFADWALLTPMTRRAGVLSGGQRQRLAWAMTVLGRARENDVVLADEPEAGLSQSIDLEAIPTLVLATHHSQEGGISSARCDRRDAREDSPILSGDAQPERGSLAS